MNDINNLIFEELSKMSQLFHHQRGRVISEQPAKDVTDLKTYPACVQKLPGVKITQTATEVFAKADSGPFLNYRFYNNGFYSGPKKRGRYSCNGTEILIDGKKLTTTSTTYPGCITNKGWGEPVTTAKGQTYIKGGETEGGVDFTGYAFYNNNRVLTPERVLKSYKCSADNTIISIFATPAKAPAATTPKVDNSKFTPAAMACIKQFGGEPKPVKPVENLGSMSKSYAYVQVIANNSTVNFGNNYEVQYLPTGGKMISGQWTCKENIFNIFLDDDSTWSKAQGGWKGPASKISAVKPKVKRGNTQKLSTLTQDVQKSIGGTPSGKFSSQELDSILQRLGGNDVKSEVSQGTQTTQSFPTDASGKPDLDKILASLSQ
jgi:hypothetical protein